MKNSVPTISEVVASTLERIAECARPSWLYPDRISPDASDIERTFAEFSQRLRQQAEELRREMAV
jgi:hypothetical protein